MRRLGPKSSTSNVTKESLGDPDLGPWVNHLHWSNQISSEDHVFSRVSVDRMVTRVELLPWWCWTPSLIDVPPWTECFGWRISMDGMASSCPWCVEGHHLGPTGTSLASSFQFWVYSAFLNEGISILVCPSLLFPLSHPHLLLPLLTPPHLQNPRNARWRRCSSDIRHFCIKFSPRL